MRFCEFECSVSTVSYGESDDTAGVSDVHLEIKSLLLRFDNIDLPLESKLRMRTIARIVVLHVNLQSDLPRLLFRMKLVLDRRRRETRKDDLTEGQIRRVLERFLSLEDATELVEVRVDRADDKLFSG